MHARPGFCFGGGGGGGGGGGWIPRLGYVEKLELEKTHHVSKQNNKPKNCLHKNEIKIKQRQEEEENDNTKYTTLLLLYLGGRRRKEEKKKRNREKQRHDQSRQGSITKKGKEAKRKKI